MKCFRFCCCLLCALVLLSTVFSINAHAKENVQYNIKSDFVIDSTNIGSITYQTGSNASLDTSYGMRYNNNRFHLLHTITPSDNSLIAKDGETIDLSMSGFYVQTCIEIYGKCYPWTKIDGGYIALVKTDGTLQYFYDITYDYASGSGLSSVSLNDIIVEGDVRSVIISLTWSPLLRLGINDYVSTHTFNFWQNPSVFEVDIHSREEGLLSGLLDWVKGIKGKIDDTFSSITSGFSDIGKWFAELPSKLWETISNGLKNLFVPDEEFIVQYKEDMDSMLEDKLGAVYQVVNITLESWDRIGASDEQDSIELPETTINLPENNKFSFGGYDVKIVPDGFSVLANAIKLIGGICITILFVNGLRKRYDEVMGVEK